MPSFYTYILYSSNLDKYYIGSTNNLERRMEYPNRGKPPFTRTGIPWILKYFEEFDSRLLAYQREMEIKKWKDRNYIESLIK